MGHQLLIDPLLGVGLYSVPRAARIVRAPAYSVRRWAEGYSYRLRGGERRRSEPIIVHQVPGLGDEHLITFRDLMELLFVGHFVSRGVHLEVVREAARLARERSGLSHPFASGTFCTDGHAIFEDIESAGAPALGIPAKRLVTDITKSQRVIVEVMEPYLEHYITIESSHATRFVPPEGKGQVVVDPQRRFGRPFVKDVGIETEVLADCAGAYGSAAAAARWFDIPESAVRVAIQYEAATRSAA